MEKPIRIFDPARHYILVNPEDVMAVPKAITQLVQRASKELDFDNLMQGLRSDAQEILSQYGYPTTLEEIASNQIKPKEKVALDAQDTLLRLRMVQHFVNKGNAKMAVCAMMGLTASRIRQEGRILGESHSRKTHERSIKAKSRARELAEEIWIESPGHRTGEVATMVHNRLLNEGLRYTPKTIRRWIKDFAPPQASKPGRPKKHS